MTRCGWCKAELGNVSVCMEPHPEATFRAMVARGTLTLDGSIRGMRGCAPAPEWRERSHELPQKLVQFERRAS